MSIRFLLMEILIVEFPNIITKEYSIHEFLGQGSYGVVYQAKDKEYGSTYAIKVLSRSENPDGSATREDLSNIMLKLNHDHIIRIHEFFITRRRLYIIMEYMGGGTLCKLIDKNGFLSESVAKLYFYQMCLAVDYLDSKNITHRDLKPDNMLLVSNHHRTLLKISDFGLCNEGGNRMKSQIGSKLYGAPEIFQGGSYGQKVDIWSLGVILYGCLCGYCPFSDKSAVQKGKYTFRGSAWNYVSKPAKSLIKSILKVDPGLRCNITYVLKSIWMRDNAMEREVAALRSRFDSYY